MRTAGIDKLPGYLATDNGQVVGKRGKVLAAYPNKDGYLAFTAHTPRGQETWKVHRLVCWAFHGAPPEGMNEVRHLDGSRTNNLPSNLRWGTIAENAQDRERHGTRGSRGERHPGAKLSAAEVAELRNDWAEGAWSSQREAGEYFGITQSAVSLILSGKNWRE